MAIELGLDLAAVYTENMHMVQNTIQKPPLGPRHWLSWLAVGVFWVLGCLFATAPGSLAGNAHWTVELPPDGSQARNRAP